MANYHITNSEFYDILKNINDVNNNDDLNIEKQIVFSALFNEYSNNTDNYDVDDNIELWNNKMEAPSELLVGKKYILIKDSVLELVKTCISSGFVKRLIEDKGINNSITGITADVVRYVVVPLCDIFRKASKLEDNDFCIYYQAMTHNMHHSKDGFTIDDIKKWLPNSSNCTCNMHNSKWNCDYYEIQGDKCNFLDDEKINASISSLEKKSLLIKEKKQDGKYHYRFKY
ncbi:MAG: hypothetical protein Q4D76_05405 [Oscillospiraceae bacterium]|nr:hypothetical protein [Oscillospiraceae bacterium]